MSYGRRKGTQRAPLIWEGVFLAAEDSIPIFEPPKDAARKGHVTQEYPSKRKQF